jgi:hypothetical protein
MTGVDWLPIQENRARATLAAVAGTFGTSQIEVIAEHLEERRAMVNLKAMLLPIYCYTYPGAIWHNVPPQCSVALSD